MKHIVIGTGGHIDHGKSTLVKVLTGTDPDRLKEEKQRGITIDLGFAHFQADENLQISFVDVPGHEKFVHNMLAGVAGIDLFLLVVAADDGVMPQTREHLAICHLLDIKQGIVAITRCDTVEEEYIELVTEEVKELVAGTFLEESPVIPVSSITGFGLDKLKSTILKQEKQLQKVQQAGFRLPVDRSFTVKGFGTVVTGTVVSGKYLMDESAVLYPQNLPVRIRGLQAHGQTSDEVVQGQRAAVNLSGLSKDEVHRGDQLAAPGSLFNTHVIDVEAEILPDKLGVLKHRSQVKMYSGTQEILARVLKHDQFDPNKTGKQFFQLRFKEALSCRYGDRFILRSLSPLDTIAGGRIIAPKGNLARKNRNRLDEALTNLASEDESSRIRESIFLAGTRGTPAVEIPPITGISEKKAGKIIQTLSSQGKILQLSGDDKKLLDAFHVERIAVFLVRAIQKFHKTYPERQGAPKAEFMGKMGRFFKQDDISIFLDWAVKSGRIAKTDQNYHLPDFEGHISAGLEELKNKIISRFRQEPTQPPGLVNLSKELDESEDQVLKVLKMGIADDWAVRVKDDIWYLKEAIDQIENRLVDFLEKNEEITVIQFKDMTGITRKHAIALLEYFDGKHITRRINDVRILRLNKKG